MKCWKCGKEIYEGTSECLYCHASQQRCKPTTDAGQAMRQIYDLYGPEAALKNPALLVNGLGDIIKDTLSVNVNKLKGQLKIAMDAGIGRLYFEQLSKGQPDDAFDSRIKILLTEDVGLNENAVPE